MRDPMNTGFQTPAHGTNIVSPPNQCSLRQSLLTLSAQDHLQEALELHQSGQHEQALESYKAALDDDPRLVDAWQLLGFLNLQLAHYADALPCYDKAISLNSQPAYHLYRGECLYHLGRPKEAIPALRRGLHAPKGGSEAHFYLGLAYRQLKDDKSALAHLKSAVLRSDLEPLKIDIFVRVLIEMCGANEALELIGNFQVDAPTSVVLRYARGQLLLMDDKPVIAEPLLREATLAYPTCADVFYYLGRSLREQRKINDAIGAFQHAAQLNPKHLEALNYLAMCLADCDRLNEAVAIQMEALKINPNSIACLNNAAGCLSRQGKIEPALRFYRRLVELAPKQLVFHSNLLFTLNYSSLETPRSIFEAHQNYGELMASLPLPANLPALQVKDRTGRPLRIGIISGDLRLHPVVSWLEAWLPHLPRDRVELVAFCTNEKDDAVTDRLRPLFTQWVDLRLTSMLESGQRMREAAVDIIIDLAGHTGRNLLHALSWRCAPIQVSMLGYPNTTGLKTMDYRITDRIADPRGVTDRFHSEKLIRMPESAWCFQAPDDAPAPDAQPHEGIVFGCFNNLAKFQPAAIQHWSRLLLETPGSRLHLKSSGLQDPFLQKHYYKLFGDLGITADRLILVGRTRTMAEHYRCYQDVDVALDTFPYHGTTTTAEALWMGVPVISLTGSDHRARVGFSLLSTIGHDEWAVSTWDEYRRTAQRVATQYRQSPNLRHDLRERMRTSSLCDGQAYARNIMDVLTTL
ncbi:MAG: tetratricopeptide repeat protein [Verrucomicrobiota bacterium]|nr:tetratricopeptide repeat protein [Verrucomicrobiota bacterium]